jgi:hypothetical protein
MTSKQPIKVEIVQEDDKRTLLKLYADGTEERTPIVKTSRKSRATVRPYWYWELGTGQRKFF